MYYFSFAPYSLLSGLFVVLALVAFECIVVFHKKQSEPNPTTSSRFEPWNSEKSFIRLKFILNPETSRLTLATCQRDSRRMNHLILMN